MYLIKIYYFHVFLFSVGGLLHDFVGIDQGRDRKKELTFYFE